MASLTRLLIGLTGRVVVMCLATLAVAEAALPWIHYSNARFGFAVSYPSGWSVDPSLNGEGATLRPPGKEGTNRRVYVVVWGAHNVSGDNLARVAASYTADVTSLKVRRRQIHFAGLEGVRTDFQDRTLAILMRGRGESATIYGMLLVATPSTAPIYRSTFERVIASLQVARQP